MNLAGTHFIPILGHGKMNPHASYCAVTSLYAIAVCTADSECTLAVHMQEGAATLSYGIYAHWSHRHASEPITALLTLP